MALVGYKAIGPVTASSQATGALSADPSAGDLVAVLVLWQAGGSETVSSISDNASGNTYVAAGLQVDGPSLLHGIIYYAKNVATTTGFDVTVTMSGTVDLLRIGAVALSGRDTTSPLGVYGGQGQTDPGTATDAITTGNIGTPSQDGHDIVAIGGMHANPDVFAVGTGFTGCGTFDNPKGAVEYKNQATAAAVAGTFTCDATGTAYFISVGASFAPPSGGGATPAPGLGLGDWTGVAPAGIVTTTPTPVFFLRRR